MISFGFFYSTSSALVNLLERTELFSVSQEIKEQLILALADLVTLVASVSTHFHKAIRGLTTASVSVNIYDTFPGQIQSFRERCRKIADAMWRHQLAKENVDTERGEKVHHALAEFKLLELLTACCFSQWPLSSPSDPGLPPKTAS